MMAGRMNRIGAPITVSGSGIGGGASQSSRDRGPQSRASDSLQVIDFPLRREVLLEGLGEPSRGHVINGCRGTRQ